MNILVDTMRNFSARFPIVVYMQQQKLRPALGKGVSLKNILLGNVENVENADMVSKI